MKKEKSGSDKIAAMKAFFGHLLHPRRERRRNVDKHGSITAVV